MKSFLMLLLEAALLASVVQGFCPALVGGRNHVDVSKTNLDMTKKFPGGRPVTVQADEDMAMWFEDKQGKRQKALKKPVGGRPVQLYTKDEVEAVEKKGVNPFERLNVLVEYLVKRPTRGY